MLPTCSRRTRASGRSTACARSKGERVIDVGLEDLNNITAPVRAALTAAGLKRPELFEAEATSRPLRFYDLRSTGITWRAVRGDEPIHIMADAGHEEFSTTQGYIRTAAAYLGRSAGFGEPFPALPSSLLGSRASLARNGADFRGELITPLITRRNLQ